MQSEPQLEVLLKARFLFSDKATEAEIKSYLEENCFGLRVVSIEKISFVSRHIGSEPAENRKEPLQANHGVEDLAASPHPARNFWVDDDPKAESEKKAGLRPQLEEDKMALEWPNEVMRIAEKHRVNCKAADASKEPVDQVRILSRQLESLAAEKAMTEERSKELEKRCEDLSKRLDLKTKAEKVSGGDTTVGDLQRFETMEELIYSQQHKFEKEKKELLDRQNTMGLSLIAARLKAEMLENRVAALEKQGRLSDENSAELYGLGEELRNKEASVNQLVKRNVEVETKMMRFSSLVKVLKTEGEIMREKADLERLACKIELRGVYMGKEYFEAESEGVQRRIAYLQERLEAAEKECRGLKWVEDS